MPNGNSESKVLNGSPSDHGFRALQDDKMDPIAIIGFAARLPGDATSTEGFWRMLCEGRSASTKVPKERFNVDAFYHPDPDRIDTTNVTTGNFLKGDITAFDAPFFAIQPTEVSSMDPQQRCMLEASYHALENAGIPMESVVKSRTCVYVGSSQHDYEALALRDPESPLKYIGTGIGSALLANRVSWFYDLRGPSVALDTACSSGLSALHLACQSLRNGEATMGLVGGCNLILAPDLSMIHLSNLGFFSPEGCCYSFDERANGYAKGEGAGVIVVKPLASALKDGDTIRAIIRATGANQDGKTPGITQPSKTAQAENIKATYHAGGLDLDVTKYFEAHGTGTQLGDPVEAAAIGEAFSRTEENPLYIGAVKPNIGHLEAASGIAAIIKTVLVLENGVIPPNINFKQPHKSILFPTALTPWPTPLLRRASVNSFGYGGANAHAVLDDAYNYLRSRNLEGKHRTITSTQFDNCQTKPEYENGGDRTNNGFHTNGSHASHQIEKSKLLVWSASDENGLSRLAAAYQAQFSKADDLSNDDKCRYIENLSYTLAAKRSNLPWKSFIVTNSIRNLGQNLFSQFSKPVRSSLPPNVSFVFTGQGAQWAGMGRELFAYPVFETSVRKSEKYLLAMGSDWALINELHRDSETSNIDSPDMTQPLCTALQVALVDLLASWKIFPTAVVGHSSGEIAAAYCAGSLSHESALRIAYYRGKLVARLGKRTSERGAMASIALSEPATMSYFGEIASRVGKKHIAIGCVNSPNNVTVTGNEECVDALVSLMEEKSIFARKLPINVAYHSSDMEEVASEYETSIHGILPRHSLTKLEAKAESPVQFSSVTGTLTPIDRPRQPQYWVMNLVSQVKFSGALCEMLSYLIDQTRIKSGGKNILIEIGPTSALQRPVKETLAKINGSKEIGYDSILKRDTSGLKSCLELIGRLRCSGHKVDLMPINCPAKNESDLGLLTDLPQYPFNHANSYWSESRLSRNFRMRKDARHELLGIPVADWNPLEPKWRNHIRVKENPWIVDHKLGGSQLYPAAGMIVMAIEASRQIAKSERHITGYRLQDVSFYRALVTSDPEGVETQLHFRPKGRNNRLSDSNDFKLYVCSSDEWSLICDGVVTVEYKDAEFEVDNGREQELEYTIYHEAWAAGIEECREKIDSRQTYKNLTDFGFGYGEAFQCLDRVRYKNPGEAAATIKLDGWRDKLGGGDVRDHLIHPITLDGLAQLVNVAISNGTWDTIPTMVPRKFETLWISNDLFSRSSGDEIAVYTKMTFRGYREADFWIAAANAEQEVQIVANGWRAMALGSLEMATIDNARARKLCYHMDWLPDVTLLDPAQTVAICNKSVRGTSDPSLKDTKHASTSSYAKVATFVALLAHKNPNLTILEVSTGRNLVTESMLQTLTSRSDDCHDETSLPRFSCYMFTDVSADSFEAAKSKFQKHYDRMAYSVLDIEQDPVAQGFELEQQDVIICSFGLYKPESPKLVLHNIRKLLKSGGKLILIEDEGDLSLSRQSWNETLVESNFSGVDISLPNAYDAQAGASTAIISTALETTALIEISHPTIIIIDKTCLLQVEVASQIRSSLSPAREASTEVIGIKDLVTRDLQNIRCIFLIELTRSLLADINSDEFTSLKALISCAKSILWTTWGGGETAERPEMGLVTGFGRVIQSENFGLNFIELALEANTPVSHLADQILQVYQQNAASISGMNETEYLVKDGILHVGRVIETPKLNRIVSAKVETQQPQMQSFGQTGKRALELSIASPGLLNTLYFRDDRLWDIPLAADEVEIRVYAAGMNFKDVVIALGQLPGNSLGLECAGYVTRVGSDSPFSPGDRVCCCTTSGAYKTFARAYSTSVTRIPDHISFQVAASLPLVYCTAYYSLVHLARLQEGESVLIHSGAGGVGQAAIQLAQMINANVFTTVGTDQKKQFLMKRYQIPEDHIFSSRNKSFVKGIMRIGDGVDVVLNSLSDEGLQASWSCVRPFSRFIELGKADIQSHERLPMGPFNQNVTFASVDLSLVMEKAKPVMGRTLKAVMDLLTSDGAQLAIAEPSRAFKVSELEKAFRLLQSGKSMGKLVIEFEDNALVPVIPSLKPSYIFDANATYVIAGGLGGLGRSIVRWMADRKAIHFLLLSRSRTKSKEALELLDEMRLRGVNIAAPPCDISIESNVSEILKEYSQMMPPIKGCIQATMVLKDGLFANSTHTAFTATLSPKVAGSWNLHTHLPRNLTFFVLLTSVCSIAGSRGQSNYGAANTYQNALARHRISRGEKCVALDLGPVLSIGVVAENDLAAGLEAQGLQPIRAAELFALLEYACDPDLPLPERTWDSEIVTGLGGTVPDGVDGAVRDAYWAKRAIFGIFRQANKRIHGSGEAETGSEKVDVVKHLQGADSEEQAGEVIVQALKVKLASGLGVPLDDVDAEKAIHAFGIDSLVALEVRYWFMKDIKADLAIFEIMQAPSLRVLARGAAAKSEYRQMLKREEKKTSGG